MLAGDGSIFFKHQGRCNTFNKTKRAPPEVKRRGSLVLLIILLQTEIHTSTQSPAHTTRTKTPWQYLAKFGLIIHKAQPSSMLGKNKETAAAGGEGRVFLKHSYCPVIRTFCCFRLKRGNQLQSLPLLASTLRETPAWRRGVCPPAASPSPPTRGAPPGGDARACLSLAALSRPGSAYSFGTRPRPKRFLGVALFYRIIGFVVIKSVSISDI